MSTGPDYMHVEDFTPNDYSNHDELCAGCGDVTLLIKESDDLCDRCCVKAHNEQLRAEESHRLEAGLEFIANRERTAHVTATAGSN